MRDEYARPTAGPTAEQVRAAVQAKATRYLNRTGNTDVLEVLGLAEPEDRSIVVNGRQLCPTCMNPLPDPIANGGFKRCRRRNCKPESEDA